MNDDGMFTTFILRLNPFPHGINYAVFFDCIIKSILVEINKTIPSTEFSKFDIQDTNLKRKPS